MPSACNAGGEGDAGDRGGDRERAGGQPERHDDLLVIDSVEGAALGGNAGNGPSRRNCRIAWEYNCQCGATRISFQRTMRVNDIAIKYGGTVRRTSEIFRRP